MLAAVNQGIDIGKLFNQLITNDVFWVFVISSVLIPVVNAALTRTNTSPAFKSVLTLVLAGLVAVGAWITNTGGVVHNWKAAIGVFVTAMLGAGGIHAAVTKGVISDAISNVVPINIGPKMTPERAAKKHSHGTPPTEPVPTDPTMPGGADAGTKAA